MKEEGFGRENNAQEYLGVRGRRRRQIYIGDNTNTALTQLIDAVQAKADQLNVDIDADMRKAREHAEEITKNPAATNHANKIKAAGKEIVKALEKLQVQRYPELVREVGEAKKAVERIDPEVLTLEQKTEINYFFVSAGNVLRKMQ
jgi:predicted ATPase